MSIVLQCMNKLLFSWLWVQLRQAAEQTQCANPVDLAVNAFKVVIFRQDAHAKEYIK